MRILPLLALSITSCLGCQNVGAPTAVQTKTPSRGFSPVITRAYSKVEGPHYLFAQFVMNTLTELGLYDEAVSYTASVLQQNPNDTDLWALAAIALTKASAYDEAAVAFTQAAHRRPTDSEIRFQWGMSRLAAGAPTEAAEHWQQATSLDPNEYENITRNRYTRGGTVYSYMAWRPPLRSPSVTPAPGAAASAMGRSCSGGSLRRSTIRCGSWRGRRWVSALDATS